VKEEFDTLSYFLKVLQLVGEDALLQEFGPELPAKVKRRYFSRECKYLTQDI
jgi:hypothetical protein